MQRFAPEIASKTLFQYELAVSPHIAAQASKQVSSALYPFFSTMTKPVSIAPLMHLH
jgi:hypothetical protein